MTFPSTRLGIRTELAFGAGTDSPIEWTWTDVTERILRQAMALKSGRANETARPTPSQFTLELDNNDGQLTPLDPRSVYYPNVALGVPVRQQVEGRTNALILPGGATSSASTPDHASFDFAGAFDIRIRIEPEQWACPGLFDLQGVVSRWGAAPNRSWILVLDHLGRLKLNTSTDGSDSSSFTIDHDRVVALGARWIGAAVTPSTGVDFYASDETVPPADITTWTAAGSHNLGAVNQTSAPIVIGETGLSGSVDQFRGRALKFELRDGINGTLVTDPDFSAQAAGATSFVDSTGKTWTIDAGARIGNERIRVVGRAAELAPTWPFGDNARDNPSADSEARLQMVVAGIRRQLTRNAKPLRSALYRACTQDDPLVSQGNWPGNNVAAYWPMEDNAGALTLASASDATDPLTMSGADLAADSTLPGSGPLPTIRGGETAAWSGTVPETSGVDWAVNWVFRIPTADSTERELMVVNTAGTAVKWTVSLSSTTLRLQALDGGSSTVLNFTDTGAAALNGPWVVARLAVATNGGFSVDWTLQMQPLDTSPVISHTANLAETWGRAVSIEGNPTAPADGMSLGHIFVEQSFVDLDDDWMLYPAAGWVGETAARRFWRLCAEEGIVAEVIGDPTISVGDQGDINLSEPMGPQRQATIMDLLDDCAAVDGGQVLERRRAPGLVYRTRRNLTQQATAALTLDGSVPGQIRAPFNPVLDDQRTENDVTIAAAEGSSSRATDPTSIAAVDLYDVEETVNGVGGVTIPTAILAARSGLSDAVAEQNNRIAQRRLLLGTWPAMRYPAVAVDLGTAPDLIDAWLDLFPGDRVRITNLPAQHPVEAVELIVEGLTDRLTPTDWDVEIAGSPGGPWLAPLVFDDYGAATGGQIVLRDTATLVFAQPNDFRTVWDVPLPATIEGGDLIEVVVALQESTERTAPTFPAGWFARYNYLPASFGVQTPMVSKFYKIAAGSPGAASSDAGGTLQLTYSTTTRLYGRSRAWANVDNAIPYDVAVSAEVVGSADPNPPSITPVTDGAVVVVDLAGNADAGISVTSYPTDYTPVGADPTLKGIIDSYRRIDVAAAEDPGAYDVALNNSTVITDALRPDNPGSGTGGFARVASNRLDWEMDPAQPSTFNQSRTKGQWIIAGNRFNVGESADNIGPTLTGPVGPDPASGDRGGYDLAFVSDEVTGPAMDGGSETRRLAVETRNGRQALVLRTVFVDDGSYSYVAGVTNLGVNRPPSDPLFADGTRFQLSLLDAGDAITVGGSPTEIRYAWAFEVRPWMFLNTWTTGPEIHAPDAAGRTSPLLFQWHNGFLNIKSQDYLTDTLDPGETITDNLVGAYELPASGTIVGAVLDAVIDPLGSAHRCDLWIGIAGGPMTRVINYPSPFGYQLTTGAAEHYFQGSKAYRFHQFTPGPANNWDASSASGNIMDLPLYFEALNLDGLVSTAEMIAHARHMLNL